MFLSSCLSLLVKSPLESVESRRIGNRDDEGVKGNLGDSGEWMAAPWKGKTEFRGTVV